MYQVSWLNKRGAGCVSVFTDEDVLEFFVSNLRREATIRDESNRIIGGVKRDGRKWIWWFESKSVTRIGNGEREG